MAAFHPDYTIHLGDVYYIGDEVEVDENFLGIQRTGQTPVQFPRGAVGTLVMPGNHELYGGGRPFYTKVLAYGSPTPGQHQRASFFCLESDHWRIIGLDTGYNSAGVPILGSIPGLRSIKALGGDGRLEQAELDWLRSNVRPQRTARRPPSSSPTTSTTQPSPTKPSPNPASSSPSSSPTRTSSGSGATSTASPSTTSTPRPTRPALRCYGRCIGHGGMPVEKTPPKFKEVPLLFYDQRTDYPIGHGDTAGWNGFANLTLSRPRTSPSTTATSPTAPSTPKPSPPPPTGSVQLTGRESE